MKVHPGEGDQSSSAPPIDFAVATAGDAWSDGNAELLEEKARQAEALAYGVRAF